MISIDPAVVFQVCILLFILFAGFEWILRNEGVRPSNAKRTKSKITPEGEFYKAHPVLGFANRPGEFHFNINEGDFFFSARHDQNGHRITSLEPVSSDINYSKSRIWIFGCSFIYGWLVQDHETFPWLLQDKLKECKVTNFSVSGYSTLQSYLQCKEAFTENGSVPPEIVMVFYGSKLHDQRNAFTRNRKKAFTRLDRISPFKVPCGRLDEKEKLSIKYEKIRYVGMPLISHSAFMNYVDNKINSRLDGRIDQFGVSKQILTEFNHLCIENNAKFVIGGIVQDHNTKKMLDYCKSMGIKTVDVAVDRRPEHVHDYDFHPSPLAHQKYTDRVLQFLQDEQLTNV